MYTEDELLPISALQHLVFCERQWGLIHLEGIWAENRLTVEGAHLHSRVDESETESRGSVRLARALPLRSLRLGLSGRADMVEFHREEEEGATGGDGPGVALPGVAGQWRPFPVEYKRGRPKENRSDEVQLCAQALCLEEMLGTTIPAGALYYASPRRRHDVAFCPDLRAFTESLAVRLHELTRLGRTPRAAWSPKCDNCSLLPHCLPKALTGQRSARAYLSRALAEAEGGEEHIY